jgi:hypothetical protein
MDIITPLCLFFFRLTVELGHPQLGQVPIDILYSFLQSSHIIRLFFETPELKCGHTVALSLIVSPHFGQVVNPIPISSFLLILQSTRFAGKPDVLRQQKLTLIF